MVSTFQIDDKSPVIRPMPAGDFCFYFLTGKNQLLIKEQKIN